MENLTFGSIGNYIVAAKDGKMLFNHQIVPNLVTAGETMRGDKRVLVKTCVIKDKYEFYNVFDIVDITDIELNLFTEEVPADIVKFYGRFYGNIRLDEHYYIKVDEIESDFGYYAPDTNEVKFIGADNKIRFQKTKSDFICSAFTWETDLLLCLPNRKKCIRNCSHYIDDSIGIHAIVIHTSVYFTTGDYLPGLEYRDRVIKNKNNKIFYVGPNGKNLELIEIDGTYRAPLTTSHEQAARLPGFGQLTLLNTYNNATEIDIGENIIGNLVIYSNIFDKYCILYSIIDSDGCEHIFGLGLVLHKILRFKHKYLTPTKTKAINAQSQIANED